MKKEAEGKTFFETDGNIGTFYCTDATKESVEAIRKELDKYDLSYNGHSVNYDMFMTVRNNHPNFHTAFYYREGTDPYNNQVCFCHKFFTFVLSTNEILSIDGK